MKERSLFGKPVVETEEMERLQEAVMGELVLVPPPLHVYHLNDGEEYWLVAEGDEQALRYATEDYCMGEGGEEVAFKRLPGDKELAVTFMEDDPEIDFTALPVGATVSRVQDYPVVTATAAAWAAWGGPGAMIATTVCP